MCLWFVDASATVLQCAFMSRDHQEQYIRADGGAWIHEDAGIRRDLGAEAEEVEGRRPPPVVSPVYSRSWSLGLAVVEALKDLSLQSTDDGGCVGHPSGLGPGVIAPDHPRH